ncbi:MAG: helix-turn-helix domain-containing protein [Marinilabiliaceae bacterium]|nr:helix-turn-helix domain-containing protein [Marinilabiliaceae bacterium]
MTEKNTTSESLTMKQRRDFAQHLYLTEANITQKELAERVGVSKNTICRWVADGKWDEMRTSVVATKAAQLSRLYNHLRELNDAVESRPEGERFINNKDADTLTKLTAAIRNLETETNIGDKIEVGKEFLAYVRKTADSPDTVKTVANLFDGYIKSNL